jgi:hypothetical protein
MKIRNTSTYSLHNKLCIGLYLKVHSGMAKKYSNKNKPFICVAMGWVIGVLGFDSRWGWEYFLDHLVQNSSGAHPTSYPVGTRGSFPGSKTGVKLNTHLHQVPRSKNEWSYTSTPQYTFMAWCSVQAQGPHFTLPSVSACNKFIK